MTRILPSLKQIIRLPEDVDLLERLNNAISNAMTDNDRDVSLLARQVNDIYKRTPVRMGECHELAFLVFVIFTNRKNVGMWQGG